VAIGETNLKGRAEGRKKKDEQRIEIKTNNLNKEERTWKQNKSH